MTAIRLAQDLAGSWRRAKPERRKQIVALLFDRVTIKAGYAVTVKPKDEIVALVAVTTTDKDWRSRPGSEPQYRTLAGIAIEGIEDLTDIADGVA